MSWTIDAATAPTSPFSSQANPITHTCAASAKLLVLFLFVNGNTTRTGGAPTYNSTPMTDSGQGFVVHTECGVEVWYLINPDTGSAYNLSVPNTGAVSIGIGAVSYIPSAGGAAYDNSNSSTGTTQNPSLSLTVSATGNLILAALGSGDRDVPTAGTNFTLHHTSDEGNQTWGSEYDLAGSASPVTVAFGTARADDWGLIGISFEEAAAAAPAPNVSTNATIAEAVTVDVSDPQVLVTDNATIAEATTLDVSDPQISVTDNATITESKTVSVVSPPTGGAQDAGTFDYWITDRLAFWIVPPLYDNTGDFDQWISDRQSFTIYQDGGTAPEGDKSVSAQDDATITDSATLAVIIEVVAQDDATITDSVTVDVSDPQIVVTDNATITDSATVTVSDPQITVTDNATITDDKTVDIGALDPRTVSAQDDATVTDSATLNITLEVTAQDDATIAESATVQPPPNISATDNATVTDAAELAIGALAPNTIDKQDNATVSDSASLTVSDPAITAQDDATITDSGTVAIVIEITAQDDGTITDSATVSVAAIGAVEINVSDNLTIADSSGLVIPVNVSAQDNATITDTAGVNVISLVYGMDNLTVADSGVLAVSAPQITVTDNVTIAENKSVTLPVQTLLDVEISDTGAYIVTLTDAAVYGVTLSDEATYGVALSEATRS